MSPVWIAWATLATVLAAGLAVVVRTRWLQSHTLAKCVGLSVAIHALVAVVCAFVGGFAPSSWGSRDEGEPTMIVVLSDDVVAESPPTDGGDPEPTELASEPDPVPELVPEPPPTAIADAPPTPAAPATEPESLPVVEIGSAAVPLLAEAAPVEPPSDLVPLLDVAAATDESPAADEPSAVPPPADRVPPADYADRSDARREAAALARGGSEDTERAVQAALVWLAAAQSPDGRWNAARHGGGVERAVQGQHRQGAGARSDHGVTGLALLAFLGAGSTHASGPHAETVKRGIERLVAMQRGDGALCGDAEFYAALYCHGMATIALAESLALTGDESLRQPLERAVQHTLSMQNLSTGGWRYAAGDRGDTSQLGWQVMVLTSARNAGVQGLDAAEARARGFLGSVSSGRFGGLAAYRPGERPSVTMTAEALVCRLLLGTPVDHASVGEALGFIATSPPQASHPNAYTWYYATLASYHAGGPQWEAWNARLQAALVPLQRRDSGPLAGSWDPDPVWGGHGGRVYSTALSALTLEVYYRYLPMHDRTRLARRP